MAAILFRPQYIINIKSASDEVVNLRRTDRNALSEPFIFLYPYKHYQLRPWCVTLQVWSVYFHSVQCFVNNRQARDVQRANAGYDMLSGTNGQFASECSYK